MTEQTTPHAVIAYADDEGILEAASFPSKALADRTASAWTRNLEGTPAYVQVVPMRKPADAAAELVAWSVLFERNRSIARGLAMCEPD